MRMAGAEHPAASTEEVDDVSIVKPPFSGERIYESHFLQRININPLNSLGMRARYQGVRAE